MNLDILPKGRRAYLFIFYIFVAGLSPQVLAECSPSNASSISGSRDMDLVDMRATVPHILNDQNFYRCYEEFSDGSLTWGLQTVRAHNKPNSPVLLLLHDDESTSFRAALEYVNIHGGTIVMIEADEQRNFHGVDPNRHFGNPRFAAKMFSLFEGERCVVTMHNNSDNDRGGRGIVYGNPRPGSSLAASLREYHFNPMPAPNPRMDYDNVIILNGPTRQLSPFNSYMTSLFHQMGGNVIYEDGENGYDDGSMSFAATNRGRCYVNIEAQHGDWSEQRQMLQAALAGIHGFYGTSPQSNLPAREITSTRSEVAQ